MHNPGELDQRVIVQKKVRTPGRLGGFETTWKTVQTIWAKVTLVAAREDEEAERAVSTQRYKVKIWADGSIKPSYRLLWNGYQLNIVGGLHPASQPMFMTVECESGALS